MPVTPNLDRQFDLAKIAYLDARSELIVRLQQRESWLRTYLVGSISILGGLLFASQHLKPLPVELYLISPVFSLAVAQIISSNVRTVERISEYTRRDLNAAYIALGAWVPLWEWHVRSVVEVENTRRLILLNRVSTHLIAIHFPAFLAIGASISRLWTDGPMHPNPSWNWFSAEFLIVTATAAIYCMGVVVTLFSYRDRSRNLDNPVEDAPWAFAKSGATNGRTR